MWSNTSSATSGLCDRCVRQDDWHRRGRAILVGPLVTRDPAVGSAFLIERYPRGVASARARWLPGRGIFSKTPRRAPSEFVEDTVAHSHWVLDRHASTTSLQSARGHAHQGAALLEVVGGGAWDPQGDPIEDAAGPPGPRDSVPAISPPSGKLLRLQRQHLVRPCFNPADACPE